jgi:hypothetical protein
MAATSAVALTLLAGTPALTFAGTFGDALAVALHRGGLLLGCPGAAALDPSADFPCCSFYATGAVGTAEIENLAAVDPAILAVPIGIAFGWRDAPLV